MALTGVVAIVWMTVLGSHCVFSTVAIYGNLGNDTHLQCKHGIEDVQSIIWYFNYKTPEQSLVTRWTVQNGTIEEGQWIGKTNLKIPSGDIQINSLVFDDEGVYTCVYSTKSFELPTFEGSSYFLTVTGN